MAKETIEAIKKAEMNAEQAEKNALIESSSIVQNAQTQAKRIIEEMTKDAKKQAQVAIEQASLDADEIVKEAQKSAQQQITELLQNSKSKEMQAIRAIITELI